MNNLGLGSLNPSEMPTPQNTAQSRRSDVASNAKQPVDQQDRIAYGVIIGVSENSMVKIRKLDGRGKPRGPAIANGAYLPLINPLSVIHLNWGYLRKGLIVRLTWKGKLEPNASTLCEVVADENHNFLAKQAQSNQMTIGPWRLFSGGMLG